MKRKGLAREAKKHREARLAFKHAVLERDPVCRLCGAAPSVDAHHIRAKGKGGTDDPALGAGLCRSCHTYITHTAAGIREARKLGLYEK